MKHEKQNGYNFGKPEQNGNQLDIEEMTLSEEAALLIRIVFEEDGFEDLLMNYPHHAAYCFAAITRLVDTTAEVSHFARRLGMWLWIEVFSFQIEEPLSIRRLAKHFDTNAKTIQNAIDELVKIRDFDIEWHEKNKIKLIPRMSKETVYNFAERVLSGIEAGEQEEGVE
ncbi:MAG: hypothetical protein OXI63_14765 [Candidatus Poribacteria bacterium]|nr:hypothetical protein [Candidatus Poribacteria bacterium]